MEESRQAFRKETFRKPGRWEDNIRIDLKEISIKSNIWVVSTHERDYWRALVIAALNLWVPYAMELVVYLLNK